MSKPDLPRWADTVSGDPGSVFEPADAKKDVGWLEEMPPFNVMNWIHYTTYAFMVWLMEKAEKNEQAILRSSASATWSGTQIAFTQALQLVYRIEGPSRINQIAAGASPISLSDGQVLVIRRDDDAASPVTLTSIAYASLADGNYSIVADSSLTDANEEQEIILFRRRGTDLEIPITGQVISAGETFLLGGPSSGGAFLPPVGSIIPFYDFNALVTFDSSYWAYCDGSVLSNSGSVLNGQTLPDLSNRYLVGFGTEGGGDNDSAAWSVTPVGNASHQVNLSHAHTVNGHTHDLSNHTHTGPSHTHTGPSHVHDAGDLQFRVLEWDTTTNTTTLQGLNCGAAADSSGDDLLYGVIFSGVTPSLTAETGGAGNIPGTGNTGSSGTGATGSSGTGATGTPSTNTSGSTSPGTDTQLSSTQSIQPRSIRVRFIMRVK